MAHEVVPFARPPLVEEKKCKYDVFICHASADIAPGQSGKHLAACQAVFLKCMGVVPWLDRMNIANGQRNEQAIVQGIASSRMLLAVVTKGYFKSNWTQRETLSAHMWGKKVLPAFHPTVTGEVNDLRSMGHIIPAGHSSLERFTGRPSGAWLADIAGVAHCNTTSTFAWYAHEM